MHEQRPMSTYPALLEPVCRRRQLPATPTRRSSSPRMLPTPPPLSPDFRCPSAALLERRPSGRVLPKPPGVEAPPSPRSTCSSSSEPPVATPEPIPELPLCEVEDDDVCQTDEGYCQPASSPSSEQKMKMRVHSASLDSVQLTSKSNSDVEDPVAHGLDPALYGPQAPITCSSPCGSDSAIAVPSSSSFTGSEPRPTGLGLVHTTLQHFPVRKRLRVSILKIEALAGQLKPELEIHAICKVSIANLKTGKEQSSEVKRGRNPVFNQEFFFDNVTIEDLDTKSVTIAAYHQGGAKLGKDVLIGEAAVPLREIRELNTKKEIRVIEELKTNPPKKLGKLYISTCIEKDSKRLTINVKKVEDLPRWGFTGAPDVCVKITMAQSAKEQTKQTRVLKSTTCAVYNEAVMFLFDTSRKELDATKITIAVVDQQRTCTGDDVIGCAYLGCLATDKSELEQWKNTVEHLGKEYKAAHHLKPHNSPPPVHVAEAGDNGADVEEDYY